MDNKKNSDEQFNQIIKVFYDEKMNKESRKFVLLMLTKFFTTETKKSILKRIVDASDDQTIDILIEGVIDIVSDDRIAENVRNNIDKDDKRE